MNKKYFLIFSICFFLISNSFASTNTYERTLNNLKVSEDIEVTEHNRDIILKTPKVDENEKIYDFADLFSESEEKLLYDEITDFITYSDLDMAIVTIDKNPKNSAMNYADDFYDYNEFGIGATHDGLLFLIDMDTREMWISTTGNAILMYDDNRIDAILYNTYVEIANQNYYECGLSFIETSKYYFELGIPVSNKDYIIDENGDYIYNNKNNLYQNENLEYLHVENDMKFEAYFIIISFVVTLIVVLIMLRMHKTIRKATNANLYIKNRALTYRRDDFITSNTNKYYDPIDDSTSSGGSIRSRGGSSTHRSSSGRSHGGGGRRF